MYRSCIHCRARLPENEALEALPIGRRVAFDAKRGRLWVVCRQCERWNLTPFDARWEAIEQAERLFRDTRVRASTDQIGLARLRDGTELVRIGEPLRPEFAAWRYGDHFGRRRTRTILTGAGIAVGAGAAIAGGAALGAGVSLVMPIIHIVNMLTILSNVGRPGHERPLPDGGRFIPFGQPRLIESGSGRWGIEIGYAMKRAAGDERGPARWSVFGEGKNQQGVLQLYERDALPVLREYLPRINRAGASSARVGEAVQMLEQVRTVEDFPRWATSMRRTWSAQAAWGDMGDINFIPAPARLALEMALHEDAERRVLEGELAELERAWAEAEGIAAIADTLAMPPAIDAKLAELRERAQ
jgi:hypothetical protein